MWDKIVLLFSVLRKGQELSNVEVWKNLQASAALIIAMLGAANVAYGWNAPPDLLQAVANGVASIGGLLVAYWAYATSKRVGVLPVSKPDDSAGTGGNTVVGPN